MFRRWIAYFGFLFVSLTVLTCSNQVRDNQLDGLQGRWKDPSNNNIIIIYGTNGAIIAENGGKINLDIGFTPSNRIIIREWGWNAEYYKDTLPDSISEIVAEYPRENTYFEFTYHPEQDMLTGTHHNIWHVFWVNQRSPSGKVTYQFRYIETNYHIPATWIKVSDDIESDFSEKGDILLLR